MAPADEAIDEKQIEREIKRREEQFKNAQRVQEYREMLKYSTLDSFTDRPEPVSNLRLIGASPSMLEFEWDEPFANNS